MAYRKVLDVLDEDQAPSSRELAIEKALSRIGTLCADGGDGEIEIHRLTIRRQDQKGWLLVAGVWELSDEVDIKQGDRPIDHCFVAYAGSSTVSGCFDKFIEAYEDGSLTLYADKFADKGTIRAGKAKRRAKKG